MSDPTKIAAAAGPTSSETAPGAEVSAAAERVLDQAVHDKSELSTEDIDSFLAVQDPEFAAELGGIQADSSLHAQEVEIDLETAALHDEIEKWRNGTALQKRVYGLMPWLPKLNYKIQRLIFRGLNLARAIAIRSRSFSFDWGKWLLQSSKKNSVAWARGTGEFLGQAVAEFKVLSLKLKLALAGFLVLIVVGLVVVTLAWKGRLLPAAPELFVTDLADHATEVYQVDPAQGFENFYDNVRSTPNLLLIEKMVINLKPTPHSGSTPMAALDLFVEGLNPDVVIEVKDRENFFRDLIQRTTEEFSYDDLETTEGKQKFIKTLLKELNRNLTTGELRNIRLRTLILKP